MTAGDGPCAEHSPRWSPDGTQVAFLSDGAKAVYLFAAFVLASPLGLLLALLPRPVYSFYKEAPQLWGLSDLTDQQIAGVTMAVEQAIVFFVVFAHYLARFLRTEQIAGVFSESPR